MEHSSGSTGLRPTLQREGDAALPAAAPRPSLGPLRTSPPAGTVTLLLGQVTGLSPAGAGDLEARRLALRRVLRLMQVATSDHGGYVHPAPDARFGISFPKAAQALSCALALQVAVAAERWPGGLEVRVHVGVHTGDADLDDAGWYVGTTVDRCARLRDLGHPGQMLVSTTTHDIVGDELDAGVWLEDLGRHRLSDLGQPERIFQLHHPDLPEAFPPVKSLDALPNNLPIPTTSFLGRAEELRRLSKLLSETRLLTLTGSAGCGKTRMALHLAAGALARFPDGCWWADLGPVADARLVAPAVATALRMRRTASQDVIARLTDELADRQALLVLDNCEHVLSATAELVTGLLNGCPGLTIITTTREPLGVYGEVTRRVPSLALPDHDPTTLDALAAYPATRLFVDRACAAGDFHPTDDDAPTIARVCRDLDGIPLAIELAAARTRVLDVEAIAQGLSDRFSLLTTGERSALPRQRTLEASIAWSYDLLTDQERRVLARLSVLAASFDLPAAQAVATGDDVPAESVLELLSTLVDRSLVLVTRERSRVRYHLLESVRDYARDRLAELGETQATRHRHLDHFHAVSVRAGDQMGSPAFNEHAAVLDRVLEDVRAAIRWALRSGRIADLVSLTSATLPYWMVRSAFDELGQALTAALAADDVAPVTRARTLALCSVTAAMGGEYAVARTLGQDAERLARELGDDETLLEALLAISWAAAFSGHGGTEEAEEAVAIAERLDRDDLRADVMMRRSFPIAQTASPRTALPLLEATVETTERTGDPYLLSIVHLYAGVATIQLGRWARASEHGEACVRHGRSIDNTPMVCIALTAVLGPLALLEGRYDDAREFLEEGAAVIGTSDNQFRDMAAVYGGLVDGAMDQHDAVEAALAPTVERWRGRSGAWWVCFAQVLRATSARIRGDLGLARRCLDDALGQPGSGTGWTGVQLQREAAWLARAEGDVAAAETHAYEALARGSDGGLVPDVVDVLELLGGILLHAGDPTAGVRALGGAASAREDLGYVRLPTHRAGYQRDRDALHAELGAAAFDDAWEEGARATWAETCEYLLRGRGQRGRPIHGWASLTPTELEAVRRVAAGMTNPQVADAMFVSRNTIKTHLSHVYTKLGIGGRTELVAEALRQGVVG